MTAGVDTYGLWTVLSKAGGAKWSCSCACGVVKEVHKSNLTRGLSKSCGCAARESARLRQTTHGRSHSKVWNVWTHLRARCTNEKAKDYPRYGGRGITFDPSWESFEKFFEDVGLPPSERHTLDRRENSGNYEPGNVRWATYTEQNRNRRDNVRFMVGEKSQTLREWAEEFGINRSTLTSRIYQGRLTMAEALGKPTQHRSKRPAK